VIFVASRLLALGEHLHKAFGVGINAKGDELLIEIVNRVEVLEEEVSKQEVSIVMRIERIPRNRKLADPLALVQISNWVQFENSLSNLKSNWLHLLCHIFAGLRTLAESRVRFAVEIFDFLFPLVLKAVIFFRRNSKE